MTIINKHAFRFDNVLENFKTCIMDNNIKLSKKNQNIADLFLQRSTTILHCSSKSNVITRSNTQLKGNDSIIKMDIKWKGTKNIYIKLNKGC
jgi:hypothetical protein